MNGFWDHFRCERCGLCCRQMGLPWDVGALGAIAKFLGLSRDAVVEKFYGRIVAEDGGRYVEIDNAKRTPCPFLSPENTCSIHDVRPNACRTFPAMTPKEHAGLVCSALKTPQ